MRFGVGMNTHGRPDEVLRALESLLQLSPKPDRVAVVVNGDARGTLATLLELQSDYPLPLDLRVWPENRGPWAGHNAAVDSLVFSDVELRGLDLDASYYEGFGFWNEVGAADAERYRESSGDAEISAPLFFKATPGEERLPCDAMLLLDDDAYVVIEDSLSRATAHFRDQPACGFIQARLIEDGRDDEGDVPFQRCDWVAAGVAIRRDAWRDARPYPSWFFRSAGETVASIQALDKGWETHYLPTLPVVHTPSRRTRPDAHFHGYSMRSRYLMAALTMPHWMWPLFWPYHFTRTLARGLTGRQPASAAGALLGAIKLLPRTLRERRPGISRAWRRYRELAKTPRILPTKNIPPKE